jgi:hypothetical protein
MIKPRPSSRMLIGMIVAWQFVVYGLSVGGVFVEIFSVLGIPWNSTGLNNVIGTIAGFIILELPMVALVAFLVWRRGRPAA